MIIFYNDSKGEGYEANDPQDYGCMFMHDIFSCSSCCCVICASKYGLVATMLAMSI